MERDGAAPGPLPFTEKAFYLAEFRGRSLGLVATEAELLDAPEIRPVLRELEANPTPVVLVAPDSARLEALTGAGPLPAGLRPLPGPVWRALQQRPRVGLETAAGAAASREALEVCTALRLSKVVWLRREGGLTAPDGGRLSFVHTDELRALRAGAGPAPLAEVEGLLAAGVHAVNLCSPAGLGEELFTYAGSGTLFTAERYVDVRWLGLDDLGTALSLIERGVEEGYLARRSSEELDRVLAHAFGAFVEGRHLAGMAALLHHPEGGESELVSLYTLTRFLGEGIGGHLVAFAVERAREAGRRGLFACTTRERVGAFFLRHGFREVPPERLPASKWVDYPAARRASLRCYRLDLSAPAPAPSGGRGPGAGR